MAGVLSSLADYGQSVLLSFRWDIFPWPMALGTDWQTGERSIKDGVVIASEATRGRQARCKPCLEVPRPVRARTRASPLGLCPSSPF